MKRVLGITFAVLAMAAIALGADNTIGIWKYNAAKSTPTTGVSKIVTETLTRTAGTGGGAHVAAKGVREDKSKIDWSYTAKYDGKAVPVSGPGAPPWNRIAVTQVDANNLTEVRTNTGNNYHADVQTMVSADGKTMTSNLQGIDANGMKFKAVAVFDRQK
jgi:hypothetical protein